MKKKKIISIIILIFIVSGIFIFLYLNRYQYKNFWYNIQMMGVNKDITIEERNTLSGFFDSNYYYYIDINKKKIWKVEEQVFEYESHEDYIKRVELREPKYSVIDTKIIDDVQINEILNLFDGDFSKGIDYGSYRIKYKNDSTNFDKKNAEIIDEILKDMKDKK